MGLMRKSRLSDYKQDRMIEHFISRSTALTAASLCGVNRKTAAFFFLRLREIIALELEAGSWKLEAKPCLVVNSRWMRVILEANV
jgi:hypothetical protein